MRSAWRRSPPLTSTSGYTGRMVPQSSGFAKPVTLPAIYRGALIPTRWFCVSGRDSGGCVQMERIHMQP